MGEASENLKVEKPPDKQGVLLRKSALYLVIAVAIFLLGLIPMWLTARERARQLRAAQNELRLQKIEQALASACIDARRAEYEPARQAASDFFTALNHEVTGGSSELLTPAQQEALKPLMAQRDDLITLLARSDPASADRLSDLYVAYRKAMSPAQNQGTAR
jgi:flagellar biosynthesis/type III secretory pathway M-ring protein FliF/YscJ